MKHRGEKWTNEEVELLKYMYSSGIKVSDIIVKINHTESAISHKLTELGLASRRVLWTREDETKLNELFKQGKSYSEIAIILGKSVRSCQAKAIRLGLKKKECNVWKDNSRADFWKEEELSDLKTYIEQGLSRKEISKKMDRTEKSINCKMNELQLFIKPQSKQFETVSRRVYTVDDNYFENIDSQKKAYWLGWMITDGYVVSKLNTNRGVIRSNTVGLQLVKTDLDVIKEFSKDTNSTFPITIHKKNKEILYKNKITGKEHIIKGNDQCVFSVSSAKMVEDLLKYGVVQNKTYTVGFPELLPLEYAPGFIAGAISGDGCVDVKKNHKSGKVLRCSLAGNYELLLPIKNILVTNIGYNPNKKIIKNKSSKKLYILEMNQTETIALYYWLKDNGVSLMKRKDEIIKNYIEREKESL